MKKTIKLPKKHKKDILAFAAEFIDLAKPKRIKVTIPKRVVSVEISWESNTSPQYCFDSWKGKTDEEFIDCSPEFKKKEKDIKDFCKRIEDWGSKHFKYTHWLWENLLWEFDPSCGEKLSNLKLIWK